MRTSELPQDVVEDLKDAEYTIEQIESMTPNEVMDKWLVWNGIQGYTDQILVLAHVLVCMKHLEDAIEEAQ